jgi:hypothetical protein
VKVGQKISKGTIVGKAGSSGRSTGAHLDYGVKNAKGVAVDPTPYLTAKPATAKTSSSGSNSLGGSAGKQLAPSSGSSYKNTYKINKEALKSPNYQTYKKNLASAISSGKVPDSWAVALTELIGRESTWNPSVKNSKSSAYGYGQFIKSTREAYEKKTGLSYKNPVNQIIMTAQYVKDRYGTPEAALAFWDKNNYY